MLPTKKNKKLFITFLIIIIIFTFINLNKVKEKYKLSIAQRNMQLIEKKAEEIKNGTEKKGTTYYVSADGTSTEGIDINNPMSLEIAKSKVYYGNDRILLKRGDTFYGSIYFKCLNTNSDNVIYISSYGDLTKEKPIVSGANILYNEGAWTRKDDIYKINLADDKNYVGYINKIWEPYNIGFFKDEKGNIYGNRKDSYENLINEYDFFCDGDYLYIKCMDNPNKKLGKIVLATKTTLCNIFSNTIINGIVFQETGAYGITKKDSVIENVLIENCVFKDIGGSYQYENATTRFGNGIEFWNDSKNTIVQNCLFKNIYDAAYTLQGSDVTDGFYNNVCQDNIFINCTYPIEIFCHNNYDTSKCKFEENSIKNNIIINQGKGFGYTSRPDQYQPANLVTWIIPKNSGEKNNFTNNRCYNCRALYYKDAGTEEETLKNSLNADNNTYYLNNDTIYFIDTDMHKDKSILEEYGFDQNSTFNYLSDSEIEEISNEEILNSDNYDEIKAYYDNFDIKYRNSHWGQDTISSIDEIMNEDEYNSLLGNSTINTSYTELKNAIGKLSQNVDTISQDSVSYSYECLYNFINTIVSEYNNNSISIDENILLELIEKLDNISDKYKEIYSYYITEDSIELDTVKNDLNNTIDKYNNNLDLDIGSLENIIIKIRDLYNNSITTDNVYENVLNKNRIIYITNIVNSIIDSKINNFVAEEKGKIQVEFDRDIYEPTNENITVTLIIGDSTKITNNEGSNKYTFYENGKFIFELDIKGVKVSVEVTIANINKDYTIEDGYISNISNNTLANTLKEELNLNNYTIWHNGNELDLSKDIISTGDILKYDNKEYTLIVSGDVDKDGDCGIRDLVSLRKYLLDYTKYDTIEEMAADTNQDDSLDIKDLVGMKKIILN